MDSVPNHPNGKFAAALEQNADHKRSNLGNTFEVMYVTANGVDKAV